MSNPNFDNKLNELIKQLPESQTPQRDLWPGIEMAIARSEQKYWQSSWRIAASVAIVAVMAWMFIPSQSILDSQGDLSQRESITESLVANLSETHKQNMQVLLASYQAQPALTTNWEIQLQELEEAAEAIKKALQHEPENVALLKMLQQVYQQQIQLIENVHSPKWQSI